MTEGEPLFSSSEAADVIRKAENEDVDKNEYESGKYKLGGMYIFMIMNDVTLHADSYVFVMNSLKEVLNVTRVCLLG